jgi:hypothetical protein
VALSGKSGRKGQRRSAAGPAAAGIIAQAVWD